MKCGDSNFFGDNSYDEIIRSSVGLPPREKNYNSTGIETMNIGEERRFEYSVEFHKRLSGSKRHYERKLGFKYNLRQDLNQIVIRRLK